MREAGGGGGRARPDVAGGRGRFCVCVCSPFVALLLGAGHRPPAAMRGPSSCRTHAWAGLAGRSGSFREGRRGLARAPDATRHSRAPRPRALPLAPLSPTGPARARSPACPPKPRTLWRPARTTPHRRPGGCRAGRAGARRRGMGATGRREKKREKKMEMDHAAPPQHHFPFLSPLPHTHTPPQMRTHIAPSARLGGAPAGAVLPVRPARARRAAPRTVSVKAEKVRQTRGRRDASAGVPLSGGSPRLCGLQPARPVPAPPRPAACGATLGIAPHSAAGAGGAGGQAAGGGPQLASLLARKAPEKKESRRGLLGRRPGPGPGLHLPAIAPHRPLGYVPHAMGWVRWPENVCNCPGRTPRATSFLSDGPQLQHKLTPLPIPPSPSLPLFLPRSSASTSAPPTPPAASWRAASPPSSPTPRAPAPRRPSSPTPRQATAWSAR